VCQFALVEPLLTEYWRREQLIGGGPWVVVYTRGPLLWQQATAPGKVLNSGNQVHITAQLGAHTRDPVKAEYCAHHLCNPSQPV